MTLTPPYWLAKDQLPGLDFNRCIVEPGTNEQFPEGAIGIYVDDDFWAVAALPYEKYSEVSIEDIVAEYWPHYVEAATYAPDHGTMEQRVYFANSRAEAERARADSLQRDHHKLQDEIARLRKGRSDISPRRPSRLELTNNYFVRQYEHLLVAMAHTAIPRENMKGVCSICGLVTSDRVHAKHWIAKHDAGYEPTMEWLGNAEE